MDRRAFLAGALVLLAAPLAARAQPARRTPRVGVLSPRVSKGFENFRLGMRDLGYIEGESVVIEFRIADEARALPELAARLVGENVDVVFAGNTGASIAAKQATSTIPIVMAVAGDPVESGLVASLAHPGGNVTGMAVLSAELSGKRVALLKEALPQLSQLAVVWNPANAPGSVLQARGVEAAARALGVQHRLIEVRSANELRQAFDTAAKGHAHAMLFTQDALFYRLSGQIAELALKHRMPTLTGDTGFAAAGGLMNFGGNTDDAWRHSAVFVDKILKGAKPADLPVEQLTKVELVINLNTAKALGLTIPQSVLLRADEVIE